MREFWKEFTQEIDFEILTNIAFIVFVIAICLWMLCHCQ